MGIKKNQIVTMNYELKINNEILDTNIHGEPIKFKYGQGEIIHGLENKIATMNEGEKREIKVSSFEAYGKYNDELAEILPISDFEGINLKIGMVLEADDENGETYKATVTDITKENVTVDYNHPLAGSDLDFTVIIKSID